MTPKKKAIQLTRQMYKSGSNDSCEVYRENAATRCALIAVDEIIDILTFDLGHDQTARKLKEHWQQIKNEINKL